MRNYWKALLVLLVLLAFLVGGALLAGAPNQVPPGRPAFDTPAGLPFVASQSSGSGDSARSGVW